MNKYLLKIILRGTEIFKPIIVKIVPVKWLRTIKRAILSNYIGQDIYKKTPFEKNAYLEGINLIGSIKSEIGLGQSCRLLANAIMKTRLPYTLYNYKIANSVPQRDDTMDKWISNEIIYNINIIHINPYDLSLAFTTLDDKIWRKRYNVGYWLWELEDFPREWDNSFNFVDEIWTPAEFVSDSIRKNTSLPVTTIPYAIKAETDEAIDRKYFNLPESKFLYLTMFDSNSHSDRKNPIGAINAFKKAFAPDDDDVALVIKINNPQNEDLKKLQATLENYKNVIFIDKILTKIEVNSLIKNCDVLISLHRAEGYGLPIAEAMLLGTPTVVTNWSANTEFCAEDRNCLVSYELVELEKDIKPYKKGNRWAEPDVDHAVDYIIKLKNDKSYYDEIKTNAQNYINTQLSEDKIARLIEARVEQILKNN